MLNFTLIFSVAVFAAVFVSPFARATTTPAYRVCRVGPPLGPPSPRSGLKNFLVIGDSISIGYTPFVANLINQIAQTQHAPDSQDGGALDTKYGVQCLEFFTHLRDFGETSYDAVVFNWGMHDVAYDNSYPIEFTPLKEYGENLQTIANILAANVTKNLAFALTTPIPYNVSANELVVEYNARATEIMTALNIPLIDMYTHVIDKCGPVPYFNCSIQGGPHSVHYTPAGYQYLAQPIAAAFSNFAQAVEEEGRSHVNVNELKGNENLSAANVTMCPDHQTGCPAGWSCVPDSWANSGWGCCGYASCVNCGVDWYCCPQGSACAPHCSMFGCNCTATKL